MTMRTHDDCESKISIWWDIENCRLPQDVDPHFIAQNLSSALQQDDLRGPIEIHVLGDLASLQRATQKALTDTGIKLTPVPQGNKDAADKAILIHMLLWALDNPPPAHFLLISGDGDYAYTLNRLRQKRYSIHLACPAINLKPALLGAAKKVWYWKDLAKGQLAERDSSQPTGMTDEQSVSQSGRSKSFVLSGDKFQQKSVLVNTSAMQTQTSWNSSGFDSSQKMGLGLVSRCMGDSVTTGSAISNGEQCASELQNLCLQSKGNGYLAMDENRDCNQSVTFNMLDSRSHSNPLSHDGRHRHLLEGTLNYGVSEIQAPQSGENTASVKVQGNYVPSLRVQNFYYPVASPPWAQSDVNAVTGSFLGHTPQNPALNNTNFRMHFAPNMASGNALNFKPPSPRIPNAMVVPRAPSNHDIRPRYCDVAAPQVQLKSQSGKCVDDVYLDKVYCAMKTLELNMLAPTEANLLDCIHYWDEQSDNFNFKRWLNCAMEQGKVTKTQLGQGLPMFFPPDHQEPWPCIDPGNMQEAYHEDIWNELRQFLLHGEQRSFLNSRNGYEAALILKNSPSSCIRNLVIGKIMNVLQQAILQKRWIQKSVSGWSPLIINKVALRDC